MFYIALILYRYMYMYRLMWCIIYPTLIYIRMSHAPILHAAQRNCATRLACTRGTMARLARKEAVDAMFLCAIAQWSTTKTRLIIWICVHLEHNTKKPLFKAIAITWSMHKCFACNIWYEAFINTPIRNSIRCVLACVDIIIHEFVCIWTLGRS